MPQRTPAGHNFLEYSMKNVATVGGLLIAQEVYPAPQPYVRLPNVQFTVNGTLGISLAEALNPAFTALDNANSTPHMSDNAKRITLRIKWPGYPLWSEIIHLYDHTYDMNPNTMRRLAHIVAQKVQMFWNDLHNQPYNEASGVDGWQLQRHPFNSLYLLELRHVSQGSWQPVLVSVTH